MKIITIIGARPQFIKAASLNRCIRNNYIGEVQEILVHTGQHYDKNMSEVFFDELEIPHPDYNLGVGSGGHGAQTGKMLIEIEEVLIKEKPDLVLIYGDTNSTIAGSLAASKLHIPVAHVEAGLRSFNMLMPEEQNRILTDHISNYLFCPTQTAIDNLQKEGIYDGKKIKTSNGKSISVKNTGDIMYDAVLFNMKLSDDKSIVMDKLGLQSKKFILSTVHRAENTDDEVRLTSIFKALAKVEEEVILALHPRTKKYLKDYQINVADNVRIIDPIGYLDMIQLEKNADLIMTDSGGVQKEAFFMSTPCITLRDETEWIETLNDGWNTIVGADKQLIESAYKKCRSTDFSVKEKKDYFGDGHCSEKIILELISGRK